MQNPLAAARPSGNKIVGLQSTIAVNNSESLAELKQLQRQLQYPHRVSVYREPPPVEISIEDFETFAIDRLQGIHNRPIFTVTIMLEMDYLLILYLLHI